jgi:ribonuclease HI
MGMREALYLAAKGDTIRTDSKLVWGQLTQGWKVKQPHLVPLVAECKILLAAKQIIIEWVSRRENNAGILIEKGII